jgi:putative transposase
MARLCLVACQPRPWRTTTVAGVDPAPADQLAGDFSATEPGQRLVGDITYIRTWEGWLYLATVIDLYTKEVIGWSMADHMRTSLICDAITMAHSHRDTNGAIFHSDRGSQYTSIEFHDHLTNYEMTGSMGRTGVCWDNALAESFFASLKKELVYRTVFSTRKKARDAIAEYIEIFYNRQRLHSGIDYRTPLEVFTTHNTSSAA